MISQECNFCGGNNNNYPCICNIDYSRISFCRSSDIQLTHNKVIDLTQKPKYKPSLPLKPNLKKMRLGQRLDESDKDYKLRLRKNKAISPLHQISIWDLVPYRKRR